MSFHRSWLLYHVLVQCYWSTLFTFFLNLATLCNNSHAVQYQLRKPLVERCLDKTRLNAHFFYQGLPSVCDSLFLLEISSLCLMSSFFWPKLYCASLLHSFAENMSFLGQIVLVFVWQFFCICVTNIFSICVTNIKSGSGRFSSALLSSLSPSLFSSSSLLQSRTSKVKLFKNEQN